MNNSITPQQNINSNLITSELTKRLNEQSKQVYRRQGYIGKAIDKTKSITGLGRNHKKITNQIKDFENGKIDFNTVDKAIKDYKYGQRDASELVLDTLTGLAGFGIFSGSQKLAKFVSPFLGKDVSTKVGKFSKPIGIGLAVISGMTLKPVLRFFDRIYLKRREKRDNKTFWKDTLTGALDGAMAPVSILKGAMLGIPLVMTENSLQRYLFIKRDDKKSVNDFLDKQKDNLVLKGAAVGVAAYKARKLHLSLQDFDKAIAKAFENVKNLTPIEKSSMEKEFMELLQMTTPLLDAKLLTEVLGNTSIENKMRALETKNILIPKILQMVPENTLSMLGKDEMEFMGFKFNPKELAEIITRFKSDCPQSRTVEEAQEYISKTYNDKYTIIKDKALGVGTIAETFLAKDNTTGKEVVIKMIKKGISPEKIAQDRTDFINIIKSNTTLSEKNINYMTRKADSLYDAWAKELDLAQEMEATKILGKNAKHYNTATPIEIKDNIYVMEKAPGIQFNQFIEQMQKENKTLSKKDIFYLIKNYSQVFFEQLLSVPKNGMKVMHADPHPGNIFIDITNKEKPFTFIDTGNVLRYTPEEAIENTLNHLDYLIGNARGIAKALLRNADLPEGMTQKQAQEIVEKGLKERVYNGHTNLIGGNIFQDVNEIGIKIMNENGIIPNQNNTNLLKAETTYWTNMTCLTDIHKIIDEKSGDKLSQAEMQDQLKIMSQEIKESLINAAINNKRYTSKQIKDRLNYISENKEQFYSTILSFTEGAKNI